MDMGLTQAEMAERLGIIKSQVQSYEYRQRLASATMLCNIADLFNCSVDELLGRGGEDG
jgi:transcriptional regulator with XRE-family HTH domain